MEFWTSHRISANGMLSVDGKMRVMADVKLGSNYFMMCPVTGSRFDTVVTSLNIEYPNLPAMYGTSTYLPIESDVATSYAFLASGNKDIGVAFRYNNMAETMRRGKANKNTNAQKAFLEHRNADFLKLYNRPWASGTVLPAGTVNRFSGDYLYMQGPGLYDQFAL